MKYRGKERVWEFGARQCRRKSGKKPVGATESFPVKGAWRVELEWVNEERVGVLLDVL